MDDSNKPLLVDRSNDQLIVARLNRPDRLNAVSLPLYQHFNILLDELTDDKHVRCLIVTGAGRAFCVGADLKAHGSTDPTARERREYVETGQRFYRRLQTVSIPVIAAVNGHAIGAGLELALSCDFLVVAQDAKLRLPEIGLGTFVGGGTVYTLAQRVGVARAKELIMLGEFFSGREAEAMGLANRSVHAGRVLDVAFDYARRLARQAPVSMRLAKDLLDRAQRLDFETAMQHEAEALLQCMGTRDWKEGIDAFHEKRAPRYTGE